MSLLIFAVVLLAADTAILANEDVDYPIYRDPCHINPCENDGICVSPLDYPICQCKSGFGGQRCEKKVNVKPGYCDHSQDPENGTCVKSCESDYDCSGSMKCCPTFCESICTNSISSDPCAGYCRNGGVCTAPNDVPMCSCPPQYVGSRCETYVDNRPGQCPVIERGSFGVCGGVFCSADSECAEGQKCCNSACGGLLCTKV